MASLDVRSGSNDRRLVASGATHSNVVAATTADAGVESNSSTTVDIVSDEWFAGPQYFIRRPCFEFDTSTMGLGAVATAGTIEVKITGNSQDADNNSFNLFYFTRGSTPGTAFVANDFNEAVGTSASTAKDITGLSTTQTFTLNAGALAAINASGYTCFSLRVSGDYNGSAPSGRNSLQGGDGNATSSTDRPRLQLTYTPASSGFLSIL